MGIARCITSEVDDFWMGSFLENPFAFTEFALYCKKTNIISLVDCKLITEYVIRSDFEELGSSAVVSVGIKGFL